MQPLPTEDCSGDNSFNNNITIDNTDQQPVFAINAFDTTAYYQPTNQSEYSSGYDSYCLPSDAVATAQESGDQNIEFTFDLSNPEQMLLNNNNSQVGTIILAESEYGCYYSQEPLGSFYHGNQASAADGTSSGLVDADGDSGAGEQTAAAAVVLVDEILEDVLTAVVNTSAGNKRGKIVDSRLISFSLPLIKKNPFVHRFWLRFISIVLVV